MTYTFGNFSKEFSLGGGILAVILALGYFAYDQRPYAGVVESKTTTRETIHKTRSDGSTRRERRTRYILRLRTDEGKQIRRKVRSSLYYDAETGDRIEKVSYWSRPKIVQQAPAKPPL